MTITLLRLFAVALLLRIEMPTEAQPAIISNPASQTVTPGAAISFGVTAQSTDAPSYQWRFRSKELPGETNATLRIASASVENLGSYSAVVRNSSGDTESKPAKLSLKVKVKPPFNPDLRAVPGGSNVFLTWRGEGRLQTAAASEGPWTNAAKLSKNEFTAPMASDQMFYRLTNPHLRDATVYLPSSYRSDSHFPLLIGLHGARENGDEFEAYLRIQPLAESEGFLYTHPDGVVDSTGLRFWNAFEACCDFQDLAINDVAFLRGMIEQITRDYHADTNRIHMTGHSNGAFMAFRFAMENADLVASIAPIFGTMDQITALPDPAAPVSVLQIHGTADEAIPYHGGKLVLPLGFPEGGVIASAREVTERWSKWNGCGELSTDTLPTLDCDRTLSGLDTIVSRSLCKDGTAVEHWAISKGLHSPNWSTNFTKTLVQWLLDHPKP